MVDLTVYAVTDRLTSRNRDIMKQKTNNVNVF